MKKYRLGTLTVSDKGLVDTKQEIIIEAIDQMQKYMARGKAVYEGRTYTEKEKLTYIESICGRFCGVSEFLNTLGIEIRQDDGRLLSQSIYNYFFYWEQQLRIGIEKSRRTNNEQPTNI